MDAAAILARLRDDGLRLAVAESCTGGRLSAAFVAVPGASAAFLGGVVAYDNRLKADLLGVDADLIAERGAVSAAVAEAMAHQVRDRTGADMAVAVTGIAGPDGGAPGKPVGTVWMAVLGPEHVMNVHKLRADGDRHAVMAAAVEEAVALCGRNIKEWEKEQVPA